ncbi:MAG: deoxyribodipyrimidine photo-lyase [Alphaproteobacteria bacterium]|nr:deoxyribodipyrimidine photo-lyase [Alphaproteobacteria bacterium]
MTSPAIVWLRQDLRIADNPALAAAVASKRPLVLVYVLDDETPAKWRLGGASRWWLHHSLEALVRDLNAKGAKLVLRRGRADAVLHELVRETGAEAVFWNRCYEPFAVARDKALKLTLGAQGVAVESFSGALMFEPWEVRTKSGEAFKVFTPFWRACLQVEMRALAAAPKKIKGWDGALASDGLEDWALLPTRPNWATGFEPCWTPGEAGALKALSAFIDQRLSAYAEGRDLMGEDGTSRLSPHLHFGEISPVQVRRSIEAAVLHEPALQRGADKFFAELGWRDFSANLLFHWPTLPEANWRAQFDAFVWRDDDAAFEAWTKGQTGYPVVDAGMRELWATGYMHNRARMIAASFLIKHLLIDWRRGEDWFWDTLVDADLGNNAASWQWVAGSGADASPYFRIFNPVTQGERYDADGAYVRRWVPELAKLSDELIHQPWIASEDVLAKAGVSLGKTYPEPIVDHTVVRARALAAFAALREED